MSNSNSQKPESLTDSTINEQDLKKGILTPLALAGALATSQMSPEMKSAFDKATAPLQQKKPSAPFNPKTLHPDMHGIAFLESSYGKNTNHLPHSKGEFETAYGPLGFKPSTAFDEFTKTKHLTDIYPHLKDKEKFTQEFKSNPDFYNLIAGTHWNRLKRATGSHKNAAFAWTHGLGAFKKATPAIVDNDEYVSKYSKVSESKPWMAKPKEEMKKSQSFKSLAVGSRMPSNMPHVQHFDYNHILEASHLNNGYSMRITEARSNLDGSGDLEVSADLLHPVSSTPVGFLTGFMSQRPDGNKFFIENATIKNPHRGKGFGKKLYEALLSHMHNRHKVTTAVGDKHSSSARGAHLSVARDYDTGYNPEKNIGPDSRYPDEESWATAPDEPFDEKWDKYRLTLKIEDNLTKALKEREIKQIKERGDSSNATFKTSEIDHSLLPETPHKDKKQHFDNHINKQEHTPPIWNSAKADPFAADEDYHLGGEPKMVFDIDNQKYLLKSGEDAFTESTTQGVYHAAGLGHLMQKSHVSHIPTLESPVGQKIPACVISLDPDASLFTEYENSNKRDFSLPIHTHKTIEQLSRDKDVLHQSRQLVLMDYLLSNHDRHKQNLMVKKSKDGRKHDLLSIDHGYSLDYDGSSYSETLSDFIINTPFNTILYGKSKNYHPSKEEHDDWENALESIVKNKQSISSAFYNHVAALKNPAQRHKLTTWFDVRMENLDRLHKKLRDNSPDTTKRHFIFGW